MFFCLPMQSIPPECFLQVTLICSHRIACICDTSPAADSSVPWQSVTLGGNHLARGPHQPHHSLTNTKWSHTFPLAFTFTFIGCVYFGRYATFTFFKLVGSRFPTDMNKVTQSDLIPSLSVFGNTTFTFMLKLWFKLSLSHAVLFGKYLLTIWACYNVGQKLFCVKWPHCPHQIHILYCALSLVCVHSNRYSVNSRANGIRGTTPYPKYQMEPQPILIQTILYLFWSATNWM